MRTSAVRDSEYDFGKERLDLILFSWTKPLVPVQKVVDALKPGGIIVMECGQEFVHERNVILHLFDSLLIVRYEIVRTKADFKEKAEIPAGFRQLTEHDRPAPTPKDEAY